MEGIAVTSSIINAIAEARVAAAAKSEDAAAKPQAPAPPKWEPDEYTQYFGKEAIGRYDSEGLDDTVAYYNTEESIDCSGTCSFSTRTT